MRRVTVAVGLPNRTWVEVEVEVPEDSNLPLLDEEVEEKALEIAREELSSVEVSFFSIVYIEPFPDPLEGIV